MGNNTQVQTGLEPHWGRILEHITKAARILAEQQAALYPRACLSLHYLCLFLRQGFSVYP